MENYDTGIIPVVEQSVQRNNLSRNASNRGDFGRHVV